MSSGFSQLRKGKPKRGLPVGIALAFAFPLSPVVALLCDVLPILPSASLYRAPPSRQDLADAVSSSYVALGFVFGHVLALSMAKLKPQPC